MSYYILDFPREVREAKGEKVKGWKFKTKGKLADHARALYVSNRGISWWRDESKILSSYEDMCEYVIDKSFVIEKTENDIRKDDTIFCLGYPADTHPRKFSCKSFSNQEKADEYRYKYWAKKYSEYDTLGGDLVVYNSDKEARDMYNKIDVIQKYKKELKRLLSDKKSREIYNKIHETHDHKKELKRLLGE